MKASCRTVLFFIFAVVLSLSWAVAFAALPDTLLVSGKHLQEIISNKAYGDMKNALEAQVDDRINQEKKSKKPIFPDPLEPTASGQQMGKDLENFCMAYLLTGKTVYLEKARSGLITMAGYPEWGISEIKDGVITKKGDDLRRAHNMMAVAFAYDCLYSKIKYQDRIKVINKLLYEMSDFPRIKNALNGDYGEAELRGNHLWVNATAMYFSATAMLWHEDLTPAQRDTCSKYQKKANQVFDKIFRVLPEDGAGQEKITYSLYALKHMVRYLELKRMVEGFKSRTENPYYKWTYFKSIMFYIRSMALPGDSNGFVFPGDAYAGETANYTYFAPLAYRFASEFRDDDQDKELAKKLQKAASDFDYPDSSKDCLSKLCWFDPGVQKNAVPMHRIKKFGTSGEIVYRSSWDKDALMLYFGCGGFKTNHDHPDQNSFVLYYKGKFLLSDPGYTYWKTTREHNTLIVNSYGQIGENNEWLPGAVCSKLGSSIIKEDFYCDEENNYLHYTGDATKAYRDQCDLTRFWRHMAIKDKYIFLVDEVAASGPKMFSLRFHASALPEDDKATAINEADLCESKANLFAYDGGPTVKIVNDDAQLVIWRDMAMDTKVLQSYFFPKTKVKTVNTERDKYVKQYSKSHDRANLTVASVFSDFQRDGFGPSPRGFHLEENTRNKVTKAFFKNLLVVGAANDPLPVVSEISFIPGVIGYTINDASQKVVFLFNATQDPSAEVIYNGFHFKGKMVCAVFNKSTGKWRYYTKQATVIEGWPERPR